VKPQKFGKWQNRVIGRDGALRRPRPRSSGRNECPRGTGIRRGCAAAPGADIAARWYLFSGSGCRAATTPPRAAAERLARTARFAGSLCAAGRGATRRSAPSSTSLNRYRGEGWDEGEPSVAYSMVKSESVANVFREWG